MEITNHFPLPFSLFPSRIFHMELHFWCATIPWIKSIFFHQKLFICVLFVFLSFFCQMSFTFNDWILKLRVNKHFEKTNALILEMIKGRSMVFQTSYLNAKIIKHSWIITVRNLHIGITHKCLKGSNVSYIVSRLCNNVSDLHTLRKIW